MDNRRIGRSAPCHGLRYRRRVPHDAAPIHAVANLAAAAALLARTSPELSLMASTLARAVLDDVVLGATPDDGVAAAPAGDALVPSGLPSFENARRAVLALLAKNPGGWVGRRVIAGGMRRHRPTWSAALEELVDEELVLVEEYESSTRPGRRYRLASPSGDT